MKKVIITGILGQDGSNLAEHLLFDFPNEYEVFGIYRRCSNHVMDNINRIKNNPNFHLKSGDITDQASMDSLVSSVEPDFLVNFAANSFVGTSWDTPEHVFCVNTLGVLHCLEAIRKFAIRCKLYSAGSSEEFGDVGESPQTEKTRLCPVSPYAVAKVAARHLVSVYRKSYNIFAIHGTLYNHEGPKRGEEFVTRKITKNIARIAAEIGDEAKEPHPFSLGNIFIRKDWSDSRDMVRGVWMMLNQEYPIEYILASGKNWTVADFVDIGFRHVGLIGNWIFHKERPLDDYYEIVLHGKKYKVVTIDKSLYRPAEVGDQVGDYTAAFKGMGWEPKISFDDMVKDMIFNDKHTISKS